jgi:hypothetical protein
MFTRISITMTYSTEAMDRSNMYWKNNQFQEIVKILLNMLTRFNIAMPHITETEYVHLCTKYDDKIQ